MPARSLEDCLGADGGLARLAGHAARLLRMQRILESSIPKPLAKNARVANLKSGKLVIHADTGAVAAKLRQITPTLVDVFHNESAEVTGIEVRVQPRSIGPAHPHRQEAAPLGDHAKHGLTSLASRLPEDSPLKEALRRLIRDA